MAIKDNLIAVWCEAADPATDLHTDALDLTHTSGTVATAAGKVGTAGDFETGDTEYLSLADEAAVSFADEGVSGSLWVNPESVADFIRIFGKGLFNSPSDGEYLIQHTDNLGAKQFRLVVSNGSSFTSVFATTFGAAETLGTWYCVQWYHDPVANEIGIRVNGSAWDTASHSGGILDGTDELYVGGFSGGVNFDGLINQIALWRAVKSGTDLDAIYAAGSGLAFSEWGGGEPTDYTLAADSGSVAVTGTAASLERGLKVVASSGAYVVTGTDAALTYSGADKTLTAEAGSVVVTGTAASLEAGRAVAAGAGSFTVSGTAASLETGRVLTAASGSVAVNGSAAGLLKGYPLTASGGSFNVSGTAASLEAGRGVNAVSGAFTASGQAATLTYSGATVQERASGHMRAAFVYTSGVKSDQVYTPGLTQTEVLK